MTPLQKVFEAARELVILVDPDDLKKALMKLWNDGPYVEDCVSRYEVIFNAVTEAEGKAHE